MLDTAFYLGPSHTPKVIRNLLILTAALTLFTALTQPLFTYFFQMGPFNLLSLSVSGLNKFFLWQPFSYFFIHNNSQGFDLFFLITIAFNLYLLWNLGSMVVERIGAKKFLGLYLGAGILAGLLTVSLLLIYNYYYYPLAGPGAALLGIFTVWCAFYPDSEILLFFLIPIKPKWLLAGILGIITLLCIANFDFISLVFYLSGALYGYFYGLLMLNLTSPFNFTQSFDKALIGSFKGKKMTSKIVDIQTGQQWSSNDDAFIDSMLTKISKHGEASLTPSERRRMQNISERKMKEKK